MSTCALVPEDLDRDGYLEQREWSEDEKAEILRRARATAARSDDQEILTRDLDQPFGDDERRSILHRAHALLVGHETAEIVDDDRAWSEDEKAEILASARATVRRDADHRNDHQGQNAGPRAGSAPTAPAIPAPPARPILMIRSKRRAGQSRRQSKTTSTPASKT
jgi:hypothetical protein